MDLKNHEVPEIVENFATLSKKAQPIVIGLDALQEPPQSLYPECPDSIVDLDRFVKFNRKGDTVYGVNLPTARYILRRPYARFQRPITKAFWRLTSILRAIIGRQNGLEVRIDIMQKEMEILRERLSNEGARNWSGSTEEK
jgi:hypothetical protein